MPRTDLVVGRRARDSLRMPPPQPTSRYRNPSPLDFPPDEEEERHRWINWIRRGFIRCRILEDPLGSHHADAREVKCDISFGSAEEEVVVVECGRVKETLRGQDWWGICGDGRKRRFG